MFYYYSADDNLDLDFLTGLISLSLFWLGVMYENKKQLPVLHIR